MVYISSSYHQLHYCHHTCWTYSSKIRMVDLCKCSSNTFKIILLPWNAGIGNHGLSKRWLAWGSAPAVDSLIKKYDTVSKWLLNFYSYTMLPLHHRGALRHREHGLQGQLFWVPKQWLGLMHLPRVKDSPGVAPGSHGPRGTHCRAGTGVNKYYNPMFFR